MGAQCAQTSCGQAIIKWKALKEMNSKGVYTPEQISDNTDYYWNKVVGSDASTCDHDQCKEIVKKTVNYLGSLGSGKKFDEDSFEKGYKATDPLGLGKNLKAVVIGHVTKLSAGTD